ncbi:hypothetical protein GCM10012320_14950 [Sinomonas cellulolyticus]|uniref:Uncharacterized protein n=1 Tax=Sinomonas cellulolyticus TaxID=2801916 RepID=A0ABS1K093_9MICC|nr:MULTISPECIES: hypothetical protein [Sinomonas]MBL0704322.1 hypothetical protein [Sinomonas cellulolyticus]GHG47992.1 hypothetical protein GCM10012320_14950 [Sinomonas sp. KCTC 49339]
MPEASAASEGLPAGWTRYEGPLLTIWRARYEEVYGEGSANTFNDGMLVRDHRRPIAQWVNFSLRSALLVAPETPGGWPVQRFAIYYAPPRHGFQSVRTERHEWLPRGPRGSTTDADAFTAAVGAAEEFLQVEATFGALDTGRHTTS